MSEELSQKEAQISLDNELNLAKKIYIARKYRLDLDPVVKLIKEDLDQYIDDLINLNYAHFELSLIDDFNILIKLSSLKLSTEESKIISEKLLKYTSLSHFSSLNEIQKDSVVKALINKNQLKGSVEFIKSKIENNNLFVSLSDNNKLNYSIGIKDLDPKLLDKIDEKYWSYKEIGYAQNNISMEEYRSELFKIKDLYGNVGFLAFIREDNYPAIRLTKRFGFKFVNTIKSPYSTNNLIVLALD